jgi:alginate O-acetyltransferase complex protein AlgI
MTFTSYYFIFGFLPLVYAGFLLAHRHGGWNWGINWLAFSSLAFYCINAYYLPGAWHFPLILIGSIFFNYGVGNLIAGSVASRPSFARAALFLGIAVNLGALGYLKYVNFFLDVFNQAAGTSLSATLYAVPIGMSFFTFIQLGYLLDAYNRRLIGHDFGRYVVFAAFFPCVTAGPLVLQSEMMEQMGTPKMAAFDPHRLIVGLTMFGLGLAKKVVLSDAIAPFANTVFDGAASGLSFDAATAWIGALCYALQLYFDFSGYSDMAIGLGLIFGIKLPLNFDSPFKATNISDFWRRWHMTMTRFFTNYIYSGLAMNGMRRSARFSLGRVGRFMLVAALPSIVTFLVAGVWHGAGWTYVVYGAMHGLAIAIYLGWREFSPVRLPHAFAWSLTMATVASGLVMFRAADLPTAFAMLSSMWGLGASAAASGSVIIDAGNALSFIVLLGAITQLLPNTQQMLHHHWPAIDAKPETTALDAGLLAWRPAFGSALATAALFTVALTCIGAGSNFLYYKF